MAHPEGILGLLSREEKVLGELLASRRIVARETLERCAALKEGRPGDSLADVLVAEGHLSQADCDRVLEEARAVGNALAAEVPGGDRLGEFRLLREIGRGAMGIVYEAEQPSLARRVALKVLPAGAALDERLSSRFLREARAAGRLNHPGIVPVLTCGREGGALYFAMELVEGRSLEQALASGPLAPDRAAAIAAGIARALEHAHRSGLVHRDITPGNILLAPDGRARLTDFGLVHEMAADRLTLPAAVLGTPAYMAPEQARGEAPDPRSDLYSLGAVLYAMLAGRAPYSGEIPSAVLASVLLEKPPRVESVRPDTPPGLAAVCRRAMARRPDARYADARSMAEDLERYLRGEPTVAGSDPVPEAPAIELPAAGERRRRTPRARAAVLAGAGAIALTLLLVLVAWAWRAGGSRAAPWLLELRYTFAADGPGDMYTVVDGKWSTQYGALLGSQPGGMAKVRLETPALDDIAVEAQMSIPPGEPPSTLGLGLLLDPQGRAAYDLEFGSNLNTRSLIRRLGLEVAALAHAPVVAGRSYRVRAERSGSRVSLHIDGRPILSYDDPFPVRGGERGDVLLFTWRSAVRLDEVLVFRSRERAMIPATAVGDGYLALGPDHALRAFREYERVANSSPDSSMGREATYKAGVALLAAGRPEEALRRFDRVATAPAEDRWAAHAAASRLVALIEQGDLDEALAQYAQLRQPGALLPQVRSALDRTVAVEADELFLRNRFQESARIFEEVFQGFGGEAASDRYLASEVAARAITSLSWAGDEASLALAQDRLERLERAFGADQPESGAWGRRELVDGSLAVGDLGRASALLAEWPQRYAEQLDKQSYFVLHRAALDLFGGNARALEALSMADRELLKASSDASARAASLEADSLLSRERWDEARAVLDRAWKECRGDPARERYLLGPRTALAVFRGDTPGLQGASRDLAAAMAGDRLRTYADDEFILPAAYVAGLVGEDALRSLASRAERRWAVRLPYWIGVRHEAEALAHSRARGPERGRAAPAAATRAYEEARAAALATGFPGLYPAPIAEARLLRLRREGARLRKGGLAACRSIRRELTDALVLFVDAAFPRGNTVLTQSTRVDVAVAQTGS